MPNKKKTKTKVILWSAIGVLLVLLIAAYLFRTKKPMYTDVTVTTGDISTNYSFSGSVTAKNSQMLYAERAMQIKDIHVDVGQAVKSGDVLMTATGGTDLKAPFDGTVSSIDAQVNAQLMPGAPLCKVVDYSHLQLKVQVDEYDISAITEGKSAKVTINALSKDIAGTVTEVSKEGIYLSGVTYFNAIISIPSESGLFVGMSAQATVLNQSVTNVPVLPMTAIQFDTNNNPFVYMKNGSNEKQVPVTLGINDGTTVQIKSGLKSGELVQVPPTETDTFAASGRGPFGNMETSRQSTSGEPTSTSVGGSGQ